MESAEKTVIDKKNGEAGQFLKAFEHFIDSPAAQSSSWLNPRRHAAISDFRALGFPFQGGEAWKYTNVRPVVRMPFHFPFEPEKNGLTETQVHKFMFPGLEAHSLVFFNGFYSPSLSRISDLPGGVIIGSFREFADKHEDLLRQALAKAPGRKTGAFTALNTAFASDGAFIFLPRGTELQKPVHLLFVSESPASRRLFIQPYHLLIAEEHSRATVIEHHVSLSSSAYFVNTVTDVVLGNGAEINHCKIQHESENASHIAAMTVSPGCRSRFVSTSVTLGAGLSRSQIDVRLNAEEAECTLDGFYLTRRRQHADHYTLIDHVKSGGKSRQLYKGILDGHSTAVFNGKIFVRKGAQKTDASQTNKNLLLSENATINTRPQLEILADDVKCSHGAATGQLDADQIFYLKSRGLDEAKASMLLAYGFAYDVICRIAIQPIVTQLDQWLRTRLQSQLSAED